jgi:hypothetical protein
MLLLTHGRAGPDPCDCKEQMAEYRDHLMNEVIPALQSSLENHSEYWMLKETSPLREYIASLPHQTLDQYFTPNTLITLIRDQAYRSNLKEPGNSDIIVTENTPLQAIFKRNALWVPELYTHCLPHVIIVNSGTTLDKLRNTGVAQDLYIEPSHGAALYKDLSAQFWIPNEINQLICQNKKICYSWPELHQLFNKFLTAPSPHVTQLDESIFSINPNSVLAPKLKFSRFHRAQITDIIKRLSRYLGKTSNIMSLCPKITFNHCKPSDPIVYWLENEICSPDVRFDDTNVQMYQI